MSRVTVEFEIEEADLAKAKEFVATNGGSLDGLVSAFLACVGRGEPAQQITADRLGQVLLSVSAGQISVAEAARVLNFPDAGYVLHRLAQAGFTIQGLPDHTVHQQLVAARTALDQCLVEPAPRTKSRAPHRGGSDPL